MNKALQRIEEPAPESALLRLPQQITPAQAKIEAVAQLTMKAYERASMLGLSTEELEALSADFPDEAFQPGASGKEALLYIEHAYLRERLNNVFSPGQWAIVPRSRWAEPFTTGKGTEGSRIYVEAMLVIRGCFVAEAIGSMDYFPKNESTNYGDAVEGAKTASLRRCLKELGVGLQAWKKDWCESWWARQRDKKKPKAPQFTPPNGNRPKPWEKLTPTERLTQIQTAVRNWQSCFGAVLRKAGILAEDQTLNDLAPEHFADMSREQALDLVRQTKELAANPPPPEPAEPPPPPAEKESSSSRELGELVSASGFTFDQWCAWAVESGQIDENCTAWEDVPEEAAALCLKNSKTMLKSLLAANPKSKEAK